MSIKKALRTLSDEMFLAFLPFVPIDNVVCLKPGTSSSTTLPTLSESATSINQHITMLTGLLKANFLVFLKNVVDNKALHLFLESYVAYRSKPYFDVDESNQSSVQLFRLDKLVFTVYYRITCPGDEHHKILEFLPKSSVTVFTGNVATNNATSDFKTFDAEYKEIFEQLKVTKVPYLMDIISIIGDSNQHLSHKLLSGVLRWNNRFSIEFLKAIDETHRATLELVQNLWQAWGRLVASSEKTSSATKKGARVINKSVFTNKVSPSDILQEIHYLVAFAADIVYSLCQMVSSLDKTYLVDESTLYQNLCLSKEHGMAVYRIIQMIYDIAVPTVIKAIRKSRQSTNQYPDLIPLIEKTQEFLEVCQYWCVKGLMEIVEVAVYYQNHLNSHHHNQVHGKHSKQESVVKTDANKTASQTWIEVLSSPLDVDRILVGAIFDPSDLQLGALASDYLRISDRSKLVALLKSSLSKDDIANIDYFLSSLCLEESTLMTNKGAASSLQQQNRKASATEAMLQSVASDQKKPAAAAAALSNEAAMQENITMIQSIFPDLGEGFVEACLGFYKNNAEEVIEALLSDNLNPQLSGIDRSLKKMWVGKQSLVRDSSSLLYTNQTNTSKAHEDKITYKAFMNTAQQENKRFQEVQKAMVKNIEKSQEYDAYIVDKEYDDDYDDQYDDSWASKKPSWGKNDEEEDVVREVKVAAPTKAVDWRQQMAETRRYNSLLREEEKEIQFWKDMENTNRKGGGGGGRDQWKRDLEELAKQEEDGVSNNMNFLNAPSLDHKAKSTQQQPPQTNNPNRNQEKKKDTSAKSASKNNEHHSSNNNDNKDSEKSKQQQRRQYERKERSTDAHRNYGRQKKERQAGFIPGSGL